jgi:hypothetical protein
MSRDWDVRCLGADDAAWTRTLERCPHDAYHLPGYVRLEAARLGGEPVGLLAESGDAFAFLPLVLRPLPPDVAAAAGTGVRDAVSPYGYPCALFGGAAASDGALAGGAAQALLRGLARLGVCCAFVRLHPLLPAPAGALEAAGPVVRHGETVWIDLARPEEDLWRETRANYRNLIRRLAREGTRVTIDPRWSALEEFVAIYEENMRRVGAEDWYFFGADYLRRLRDAWADRSYLVTAARGGPAEAGVIFSEACGVFQLHLAGQLDAALGHSPIRLIIHEVSLFARSRGARALHLGGGLGASADSLFHFKAGFSRSRARFATWRPVALPGPFEAASRTWTHLAAGPPPEPAGFFPPYRAPLPERLRGVA